MRESLLGITTIIILALIVWFTKEEAYVEKINIIEQKTAENIHEQDILDESNDDIILTCSVCSNNINNDISFSEAFKFCRNCLGDNEEFLWNGKLYSTKVQEKTTKTLVEKEPIDSDTPPNNETIDSE